MSPSLSVRNGSTSEQAASAVGDLARKKMSSKVKSSVCCRGRSHSVQIAVGKLPNGADMVSITHEQAAK